MLLPLLLIRISENIPPLENQNGTRGGPAQTRQRWSFDISSRS
jgi:hypothetical protein